MTSDKSFDRHPLLTRNTKAIIATAWVLMQAFLFWRNGITTDGEAGKYIDQGKLLLQSGRLSSNNYWFYIVEISLIALSLKLKLGFVLPVIIQLLLNFFATFSFYKLAKSLSGKMAALLSTLLLVFYYPYQEFNTFLQTESIYYSLIILFSYLLFSIRSYDWKKVTSVLFLFLLLMLTRPSGILFAIPAGCFLYLRFLRHWKPATQILLFVGILMAFLISLNGVMSSGGELNFLLPLMEEHVICGVPTRLIQNASVTNSNNQLTALLSYISQNPGQFVRLAVKRTVAFFGMHRDYYSQAHNLMIMAIFFSLYLLSLLSFKRWWKKDRLIFIYMLATILITWFTAMLSCDDWHNRFILAIYPFFIWLSLPALQSLIRPFIKKTEPI